MLSAITILLLFSLFSITKCEYCLTMLRREEIKALHDDPTRVKVFNTKTNRIENLDFVKGVDLLCTIDYSDDIYGKNLTILLDPMAPYVIKKGDMITGYLGDIWNILQESFKINSTFLLQDESLSLANDSNHVLLGAFFMSKYTSGHFVYSTSITINSYSLFTMSEGTQVSVWWYANIFSRGLWITTAVFIIGVTFLLLIMYRLKRRMCNNYIEANNEFAVFSFNLLCVLGGVTGQGINQVPSSWSLRCLVVTSLLMGVLISCGFNSTLTSSLAIRGNAVPFTSLNGLLDKKTHSLCARDKAKITIDLRRVHERSSEWSEIINRPNCPNMNDLTNLPSKLCRSNKVAYLETPDVFLSAYRHVEHLCPIVKVTNDIMPLKMCFLYSRILPYRNILNRKIMTLHSAGILNYLERKWMNKEFSHILNYKFDLEPVEHDHIKIIFFGLIFMMFVSTFICIIENIWFKLHHKVQLVSKSTRRRYHNNHFHSLRHYPKLIKIQNYI